jgi:hypothetical protein
MPLGPAARRGAVALLAGVAGLLVAVPAARGPAGEGGGDAPTPFDGRSPRAPGGERVRVLVELERPPLGGRGAPGADDPARQRAYVRSLEREGRALRSALEARGVGLGDPVPLARVWNGFAATVRADDLPEVETLGLRAEPVRRFFPAVARARPLPRRVPARAGTRAARAPAVAVLDSGVDVRHPRLRGRVVAGFDAVRARERGAGVGEEHGTELAGVLLEELARSEAVLAVRVAGRAAGGVGAEAGTTDDLLLGLERAVDPDGDGDTDDALPVALVGVSAPYAGFAGAPDAEAAGAARRLGALVVAPAGNDGRRAGAFGTLGSPAAAPAALAVGAVPGSSSRGLDRVRLGIAAADGRALLAGTLLGGGRGRALSAPATGLAGASQADPARRGRALGTDPLEYFDVEARPRGRGRVVVVPAARRGERPALAARAAVAAAAGARALVVCDPGSGAVLRALPRGAAGATAVVGLRGEAARRALELTREDGARAYLSAPEPRRREGSAEPSWSQGPSYALAPKPDLAHDGVAEAARPGGGRALVTGTSVAAARVAAAAVALHRRYPTAEPEELAARLVGSARPAGPLLAAGAGIPDPARAAALPVHARPHLLALRRTGRALAAGRIVLRGPEALRAARGARVELEGGRAAARARRAEPGGGRTTARARRAELDAGSAARGRRAQLDAGSATLGNGGATVRLEAHPGGRGDRAVLEVELRGGRDLGPRPRTGAVRLGRLRIPLLLPPRPPPVRLGALRLTREDDRRGVRFELGAARRGPEGVRVEPVGRLVLELRSVAGARVRQLTPPGGARDLLPGEYAYALARDDLAALPPGRYVFHARARGPAGGAQAERRSEPFSAR